MKRALLTSVALVLLLALIGGTHCLALDIPVDELVFSSLEELLAAHKAVREGTADAELAELAGNDGEFGINLVALDEFYFPTRIPKEYKLYKIVVNYLCVHFIYLTDRDLISDEAISNALHQQKEFEFGFYREDIEYPMDVILRQHGATEKDLIDGIYLLEKPNRLYWGSDKAVLYLYMPLSFSNVKDKDKVEFATVDAVDIETGERQPYSPPVLYLRWWQKLPNWLQGILRYVCFGWIWMK